MFDKILLCNYTYFYLYHFPAEGVLTVTISGENMKGSGKYYFQLYLNKFILS